MSQRILIVDRDDSLAGWLGDRLAAEGFDVDRAACGVRAREVAEERRPDLVLLDIDVPDADGLDLCRTWSRAGRSSIIILTARAAKGDRVRGLGAGADDYVTKPFDIEELLARIRAVLRSRRGRIDRVRLGPVLVDFVRLQAWRRDTPLELTFREFELLRYLAERAASIVCREDLLRDVWRYAGTPTTRAVDHAMAKLRRKIEVDSNHPRHIHTVHGDGYYLTVKPE